jgi:hypothetical protein
MKTTKDGIQQQFRALEDYYRGLIHLHESSIESELRKLETMIGQSWKWRIGSFFVNTYIRVGNFISSPMRFILEPENRLSYKGEKGSPFPQFRIRWRVEESLYQKKPQLLLNFDINQSAEEQQTVKMAESDEAAVNERPVFAVILDAPLMHSIQAHAELLPLKIDQYKTQLEYCNPALFLCESAWNGNGGAWKYRLSENNGEVPGDIPEVLKECKRHKIPTVFLMNCHPEAASDFYPTARHFDLILSPDKFLNARFDFPETEKTNYFPFAVEPTIHNPVTVRERSRAVCLPLDWPQLSDPGSLGKLNEFLASARSYGLDIYDISQGESTIDSGSVKLFQDMFKGYLPYLQMGAKYRDYKAVLHIDQTAGGGFIPESILHALASGTPVISLRSNLPEEEFGNIVLIADTEEELSVHLERLLNDNLFWMKQSLLGVRAVMKSYLLKNRLNELRKLVGIGTVVHPGPSVCMLIDLNDLPGIDLLISQIIHQTRKPEKIALFTHTAHPKELLEYISHQLVGITVKSFNYYQHQLYQIVHKNMNCDYYVIWQKGNFYGSHYLEDYLLATNYSNYSFFGKRNHFISENGHYTEIHPGEYYRIVSQVPVSTLMVGKEHLTAFNFLSMQHADSVFDAFDEKIISLDALNFAVCKSPQPSAESIRLPDFTVLDC